MPRRSKGARLWLRKRRSRAAQWVIRDGNYQEVTGRPAHDLVGAERALATYIAEKHVRSLRKGSRDPERIPIADVLTVYARDVVPQHSRPNETRARLKAIDRFFGDKMLSYVAGETCRAYAAQRTTSAAARRELEELRAAINHHRRENLHDKIISVVLPHKNASRDDWLEREQAAAAIRAAWRHREVQNGDTTVRYTRRHIARFMIFARYMGSRASVICNTSIEPIRPADKPWCDLRHGVFYGLPKGHRQNKKRRQIVRIPPRLLAHLRRWQAQGHRFVVEWNGAPVKRITKATMLLSKTPD